MPANNFKRITVIMKKTILIVAAIAIGGITYTNLKNDALLETMNELALQNVEALSSQEMGNAYCFGSGNVLCPNGEWEEFVFTGYSLK